MARPKQDARLALNSALEAFEAFEQRLMAVHAAEFTAVDLTMAQAKLLYVVTASGDLSMSEIAARLGVTISTASGAVDHLVSLGLLSRVEDPANRRQVRVSITRLGLETLEQMRELSTRQLRALFDLVGDADLAVVERAIRILTQAVDAAIDPSTITRQFQRVEVRGEPATPSAPVAEGAAS
jgi:DNA-binding MarR family transcriptional regulator